MQNKSWQPAQVSVVSPSTWQAVYEGVKKNLSPMLQIMGNVSFFEYLILDFFIYLFILFMIAIDDVRITRGLCPNQGDCNFEDNTLCEYQNMQNANFSWYTNRGYGPNSIYTGNF